MSSRGKKLLALALANESSPNDQALFDANSDDERFKSPINSKNQKYLTLDSDNCNNNYTGNYETAIETDTITINNIDNIGWLDDIPMIILNENDNTELPLPTVLFPDIASDVNNDCNVNDVAPPNITLITEDNYSGTDQHENSNYIPSTSEHSDYSEGSEFDKSLVENHVTGSLENTVDVNEGRKRRLKADKTDWKRNKNKQLRQEGKAYLGFTKPKNKKATHNIARTARRLKATFNSQYCRKSKTRSCSSVSEEDRNQLFSYFWQEMTWDQRKIYVASNVKKVPSKRITTEGQSRRQGTFIYYINLKTKKVQVCRQMFLNTFDLGYKTVQDWVNKSICGMHQNTEKKLSVRESLRNKHNRNFEYLNTFLVSIPKLPSHYARRDNAKLYLEPIFQNVRDVYKLYKTRCETDNMNCLSEKVFNRKFKEKKLSVFQLKKDQCNVCCQYKTGNVSEDKWLEHRARKDRARREKESDKAAALRDEFIVLCMDLQAVKLCPYVAANAFYYKTKLCVHNFTVYNLKTHHTCCYWFSEDENCDLKASTFTSCLIDYLQKHCITAEKKSIIVYSDGCTYQNRNNVMANALLNFSISSGITIYQKYLESGHTQMERDSVHAAIERKLRNREIHLPSDYLSVTREARMHPEPYEAVSLQHNFFKDYSPSQFLRYSSIRPGRKKDDPVVTDIRCIKYGENKIQVKLNFDAEWIDLPGRGKTMEPILNYPQMYKERCKISAAKWKHLQELKSVIPKDCHHFYDTLPYHE